MTTDVTAYPLSWPLGRERTPRADRKHADFGKRDSNSAGGYRHLRRLTVAQAMGRLDSEIRAFTRGGRVWRINPAEVVVSTNVRTRRDGMPCSGAREPGGGRVMGHRPGMTLRPLVKLGSTPEACWHWLGYIQPSGDAMKQFHGRSIPARRWLWSQLFGPIKPGFVIAQMCGDKGCVNPFHLKLMSMADAQRAGLSSTLTRGDITAIREAEGKATAATLAKDFGVSAQTIREIWRGDTWSKRTRHPTAESQTYSEAA